jgi:hypothetical protein
MAPGAILYQRWPSPETGSSPPTMHTPQFIHPPDSVPGVTEDEEPGHIEAWDAVNHDDDAFVACKETVRSGEWRIRSSGR